MRDNLNQIYYRTIKDIPYNQLFITIHYNGKILDDNERRVFVQMINEEVSYYVEGSKMAAGFLKEGFSDNELGDIQRTIFTTMLFTAQVNADCMVACKYFLLADTDYDKRYMRGKLKIILNEGFKKLYGFKEKERALTVWGKLGPLMCYFPQKIKDQYAELSERLEEQAKKTSWWKEVRDMETHLDVQNLYYSREEELVESKVMIESLSLINALRAVDYFITNANRCVLNFLLEKYHRGELKE